MIRREKTSMTAAQYSLPSAVGCSVMSVSHNRLGASAVNSPVDQVRGGVVVRAA
jgi:hypothetical protein